MNRLLIIVFVIIAIAYLPGLPPHLEFKPFNITPSRPLEGPLKANEKLNGAQHLFVGEIHHPEGLAVANNTLYIGVGGGSILKIVGEKLVPVAKISHPCIDTWDEKNCGRLLGMTFDKHGTLYVADAYYGIYKVDVNTGTVVHLIQTDKPIDGRLSKVTYTMAVANDGTVYWTSSSSDAYFYQSMLATIGDPSGRLFKYDPVKKTNTLLMDGLYFAAGVYLSEKEDFVVISETGAARLSRYWLSGPKKGSSDIFMDGMPGMPDTLRSNGKGGFFSPLVLPRLPLIETMFKCQPVKRFLARTLYILEAPFYFIHDVYPNLYTGIITYMMGNLELVASLLPQGLTILEINEKGEIINSLQSTDQRVTVVSSFAVVDGYYYLGSPINNFLGRVPVS